MRYQKFLALLPVLLLCGAPAMSAAAVEVAFTVNVAPPILPVYVQPPLPAPGYIWTPGYWAWDGDAMDYYWVPGTWVEPPVADMLWTPGYWGWRDGFYGWNPGYWGGQVGYYGGVNYGFGYTGVGYQGGYWHGGAFFYNRAVANFGHVNIVNVYSAPIQVHESSRVSFNGGQGGLRYQPNAAERVAMNERHTVATPLQRQHQLRAASMPDMHWSHNGGRPQILTTARASDFAHPGPGLHNHAQAGVAARAPESAPQRAAGEPQHFAPERSERVAPGRSERVVPEHGERDAHGAPEAHGGASPGQGPRPQVSREQQQHAAPPRHEGQPKHEQEPRH